MRKVLLLLVAALLVMTAAMPLAAQDRPSIPQILTGGEAGEFNTLVAAVQAAGLLGALSDGGPFLVLAPTDAAFAEFLSSNNLTIADAVANLDLLTQILQYHVVPGQLFFRDLAIGGEYPTLLEGQTVNFNVERGVFSVNGVRIEGADRLASNGNVFRLTGVLLPPNVTLPGAAAAEPEAPVAQASTRPNIAEILTAGEVGTFTTLLAAAEAAGLTEVLATAGPFTVFAPTDDAFAQLFADTNLTAEALLSDTELLTDILLYHVVPGQFFFRELIVSQPLETALTGESLTFGVERGAFNVNGIATGTPDIVAANGNIFTLRGVLVPASRSRAIANLIASNVATVRVAHYSLDAGAVNVFVNGEVVLEGVEFGTVSGLLSLPSGAYQFGVGGDAPDFTVTTRVNPGEYLLVSATPDGNRPRLRVINETENFAPLRADRVRVSVYHLIQDFVPVDVRANGNLFIGALGFPGTRGDNDGYDTRETFAGQQLIEVTLAGTTEPALLSARPVLEGANHYLIIAAGTPASPRLVVAVEPTR